MRWFLMKFLQNVGLNGNVIIIRTSAYLDKITLEGQFYLVTRVKIVIAKLVLRVSLKYNAKCRLTSLAIDFRR